MWLARSWAWWRRRWSSTSMWRSTWISPRSSWTLMLWTGIWFRSAMARMRRASVSRSLSRGSVWMTTSAPGTMAWMRASTLSAMAWVRSKRQVAVDVDRHVDEDPGARPADADLAELEHALDLGGGGRDLLLQALRGAVEEDVDRPLAEPVADEEHDEGDAQGGHRVGPVEEGRRVRGRTSGRARRAPGRRGRPPRSSRRRSRSGGRRPRGPGCGASSPPGRASASG